jgi:DNA replication licensing factor MCM6
MDVVVRSNVTDRAKPGDRVVFTGQLVVVPDAASLAGSAAAVSLKPSKLVMGGHEECSCGALGQPGTAVLCGSHVAAAII